MPLKLGCNEQESAGGLEQIKVNAPNNYICSVMFNAAAMNTDQSSSWYSGGSDYKTSA
jgi:hypothetical protein